MTFGDDGWYQTDAFHTRAWGMKISFGVVSKIFSTRMAGSVSGCVGYLGPDLFSVPHHGLLHPCQPASRWGQPWGSISRGGTLWRPSLRAAPALFFGE